MTEQHVRATGLSVPGVFTVTRTRDIHHAVETIKAIADHRAQVKVLDPAAASFHLQTATFGEYGCDRIRIGGIRYRGTASPSPLVLAGVMVRGHGRIRSRSFDMELAAGDGFVGPTHVAYEAQYDDPAFTVVRLTLPYVATTAEQATGVPAADFRFESHAPISAAAGERWTQVIELVSAQLTDQHDPVPELLVAELLRLVATASLTTFPNTAVNASYPPGTCQVAPVALRRAIACIETRADEPITVSDIAEEAGIGPRALQEAFRRHLDTTPTAYLRRVRLEHAHRELQAADPLSGVTVSTVARRWGFMHDGRFASQYRAAYGRPPSHTLRA